MKLKRADSGKSVVGLQKEITRLVEINQATWNFLEELLAEQPAGSSIAKKIGIFFGDMNSIPEKNHKPLDIIVKDILERYPELERQETRAALIRCLAVSNP